jgi:hypothetical protein
MDNLNTFCFTATDLVNVKKEEDKDIRSSERTDRNLFHPYSNY